MSAITWVWGNRLRRPAEAPERSAAGRDGQRPRLRRCGRQSRPRCPLPCRIPDGDGTHQGDDRHHPPADARGHAGGRDPAAVAAAGAESSRRCRRAEGGGRLPRLSAARPGDDAPRRPDPGHRDHRAAGPAGEEQPRLPQLLHGRPHGLPRPDPVAAAALNGWFNGAYAEAASQQTLLIASSSPPSSSAPHSASSSAASASPRRSVTSRPA